MSNDLEKKLDLSRALSIQGEGMEALEVVTSMLPTLIGKHWNQIERIPVTIQYDDVRSTPTETTIGRVRVGINIIPK